MLSHLVGTILLFWGPFYFDKDQCSIIQQIKVYSTIKKKPKVLLHLLCIATWQNGKAIISTVNLSLLFNMAACQSFFQCLLKSIYAYLCICMSCSSPSIVSVLLFKIPLTKHLELDKVYN